MPSAGAQPEAVGLSARAVLLAAVLAVVCAFWVVGSEVLTATCLVGEAVPSIPAFACLLLLLVMNPVLGRIARRLALRRAEIVLIYTILAISTPMASYGGLQMLFMGLSPVHYYATPENSLERYQQAIPSWMLPTDADVYIGLHEGVAAGPERSGGLLAAPLIGPALRDAARVPWAAWGLPLTMWGLFYLALFATTLGLSALVYRPWNDDERLSFPLVELASRLTAQAGPRGTGGLLRDQWMWCGLGVAFVFNGLNFLHAVNPAVPALGMDTPLKSLLTERPWSAIQRLDIRWDPALLGLGYLVSGEILLSTVVFTWLPKLAEVIASAVGHETAGFPYLMEQGQGAYVVLAALLLWRAGAAWRSSGVTPAPALAAAGLGTLTLLGILHASGLPLWVSAVFLALVLANAVVYSRIRAETGAPMVWFYPFYQPRDALLNVLGTETLSTPGGFRGVTMLTAWTHLAVSYQPEAMAWQVEGYSLAERVRMRPASVTTGMGLGAVIGYLTSAYALLVIYYTYGANICPHLSNLSAWWTDLPRWEASPRPPDASRALATGAGALIAVGLVILRRLFLRLPVHPLGYAIAVTHGDPVWAPFLGAYALKSAILKIGGPRAHQQYIPLFLGLMIGHFLMAGVVWGLLSLVRGSTPGGYIVYFG